MRLEYKSGAESGFCPKNFFLFFRPFLPHFASPPVMSGLDSQVFPSYHCIQRRFLRIQMSSLFTFNLFAHFFLPMRASFAFVVSISLHASALGPVFPVLLPTVAKLLRRPLVLLSKRESAGRAAKIFSRAWPSIGLALRCTHPSVNEG